MRISALSSLIVLVAAAGAAHADRKHSTTTREVAALAETARAARADRGPALFSMGTLALTGPTRPARPERKEPFLSTGDVKAGVAPHNAEIEHCYLDQVGAAQRGGHLDLTLEIARDGSLVSVRAAAAGLPAKTTHKIEACVHEIVEAVQFPARRNDTTAVVPYFFQKTDAPGAGPILSCWSPNGC